MFCWVIPWCFTNRALLRYESQFRTMVSYSLLQLGRATLKKRTARWIMVSYGTGQRPLGVTSEYWRWHRRTLNTVHTIYFNYLCDLFYVTFHIIATFDASSSQNDFWNVILFSFQTVRYVVRKDRRIEFKLWYGEGV